MERSGTEAPAPSGYRGEAERFILTLKTDLLWTRDWETLDEVRQAVASWLVTYNHERPHQALGWNTPAEQRADNLGRPLLAAAA